MAGSTSPGGTPVTVDAAAAARTTAGKNGDDGACSPTPDRGRSRGRSRTRRHGKEIVVHERTVQERLVPGGNTVWPMLTPTNYFEWSMLMQINMEANLIDGGCDCGEEDGEGGVDTIKTMRMGVARVREATAQRLRSEFEAIAFRDGETLDAFGMRITSLVNNLRSLGDTMDEVRVVQKFLRVVPSRYMQIDLAIETMLDHNTLSVEELVGRLRSAEERYLTNDQGGGGGAQLLMTEAQWQARKNQRAQGQNSGQGGGQGGSGGPCGSGGQGGGSGGPCGSGGQGGGSSRRRGKQQNRRGGGQGGGGHGGRDGANGEHDMSQVKCYNCNKPRHFSKHCTKPRRERKEQANLARGEGEDTETSLLLTTVSALSTTIERPVERVLLNEERSQVRAGPADGRCDMSWYLDTGASNHMSGCREIFSELDVGVRGSVRLGDGNDVQIEGRGTILFECRNGEHLTLSEVYFIPRLRSNIISLGQMDELGCETNIRHGLLRLRDQEGRLIARVQRNGGRLYVLRLTAGRPVCLLSRGADEAWLWHGRYGHLNFRALRDLGCLGMADGVPVIDRVDQVCDGCALGKQHRPVHPGHDVSRGACSGARPQRSMWADQASHSGR
ncbi:uncharacterized protein [Aegilops tauschii subsp. strangulata]|uniref:uncharacterized protein n=1 Tax=Aegilops tauschii subsp. strangulata TaxID=200361 RepID=UPI00098B71B4|nr:uncharacterized protein LOC109779267 [Aegilops tauschii subsp. strangulata]